MSRRAVGVALALILAAGAIVLLAPAQLAQTIGILGAMTLIVILAMFPDHI